MIMQLQHFFVIQTCAAGKANSQCGLILLKNSDIVRFDQVERNNIPFHSCFDCISGRISTLG
ncbi:hypothetical protein RC74_18425 [Falsihalocynthiibacter arcticus]|uniref:Uncharacterized protein n=1 Tax=Falsihalocynthiibacter arcticus TaxID=1579316 RepID=A0A126V5H8_9RHOB|nr:hypothetical protein RC74_18425 [Falsihalocynthiibacter arcticus]